MAQPYLWYFKKYFSKKESENMINNLVSKLPSLGIQEFSLGAVGINLRSMDYSNFIRYPTIFVYTLISCLLILGSKAWFMKENYDDLGKMTYALIFFQAGLLGVTMMFLFFLKKREMNILIDCFELLAKEAQSSELDEINLQNRREKLLSLGLVIACWCALLAAYIPPLIMGLRNIFHDENPMDAAPSLLGSYPYDNNEVIFFVLTWFLNINISTIAVNVVSGVDCLFGWYVLNSTAHFNILCQRIESLGKLLEEGNMDGDHGKRILKQMNEFFAYHSMVISLIKQLDEVYGPVLFVMVLFNSFELCFLSFQLGVADNFGDKFPVIIITIAVILEMMFFCFGGQSVKNDSEKLYDVIYLSIPWHVLDKATARTLIFALTRAQQGDHLTGYFFVADCNLFVSILKTASSFAALVRSIKETE